MVPAGRNVVTKPSKLRIRELRILRYEIERAISEIRAHVGPKVFEFTCNGGGGISASYREATGRFLIKFIVFSAPLTIVYFQNKRIEVLSSAWRPLGLCGC